jgi:hypothetical protein
MANKHKHYPYVNALNNVAKACQKKWQKQVRLLYDRNMFREIQDSKPLLLSPLVDPCFPPFQTSTGTELLAHSSSQRFPVRSCTCCFLQMVEAGRQRNVRVLGLYTWSTLAAYEAWLTFTRTLYTCNSLTASLIFGTSMICSPAYVSYQAVLNEPIPRPLLRVAGLYETTETKLRASIN